LTKNTDNSQDSFSLN